MGFAPELFSAFSAKVAENSSLLASVGALHNTDAGEWVSEGATPRTMWCSDYFSCRENFRRKDVRRRRNSAKSGIGSKPQDRVRKIS
jgi:hypothetical protein